MENVFRAVRQFQFEGDFLGVEKHGKGHINDTYAVLFTAGNGMKRYILQRINNVVFPDVEKLMHNIALVTSHVRGKVIETGGDPDREALTLIPAKDGGTWYFDGKDYFRAFIFIEHAVCFEKVEKPAHFYESAVAFGHFQRMLADFDASQLYEIIPGFHNTRERFNAFKQAVEADEFRRAAVCRAEIEFYTNRERYCGVIVDKLASGAMPLKVTHNDTKLNNVMLDERTGKGMAVIDLDTVMPGSVCYDFGDSIRYGCNSSGETNKEGKSVTCDLNLFSMYSRGFLQAMGPSINRTERDHLAFGAMLITYECGMRFLTDYLMGDVYFAKGKPGHNLERSRTHIALVADMEMKLGDMKNIVVKLAQYY